MQVKRAALDRLSREPHKPDKPVQDARVDNDDTCDDPYRTPRLLPVGNNRGENTAAAITAQGLHPASRSTPSIPRASLAPEMAIERGVPVGCVEETIPLSLMGLSPELDAAETEAQEEAIPPTPVTETATKACARIEGEGAKNPPPSTGPVSSFLASFPSTAVTRTRQRRRMSLAKISEGAKITFPTPPKDLPKTPVSTPRSQEVLGLTSPSLRVRFPSPVIMTVVCEESDHVAVVLGSESTADYEPEEVLVFALSSDANCLPTSSQHSKGFNRHSWKLIASVPVRRSQYSAEPIPLPLNSGSIALVKAPPSNGDPTREVVLILSAVFELPGLSVTDRPAIYIVSCPSSRPPLAVEHDVPLFAIAPVSSLSGSTTLRHSLWAAGEPWETGAVLLEFDPHWSAYTWARHLPAAALQGDEAIDDICSLRLFDCHNNRYLIAVSASGLVAVWSLETSLCVSVGADAKQAIASVISGMFLGSPLGCHGLRILTVAVSRDFESSRSDNGLVPPLWYPSSTEFSNKQINKVRVMMASMKESTPKSCSASLDMGGGLDWEGEAVVIPKELQLQHGPVTAVGHWVIGDCRIGDRDNGGMVLVFGFSDGRVRCVRYGVDCSPTWTAPMEVSAGSPITSIQVAQAHCGEGATSRDIFIVISSLSGEIIVLAYPKMEAFLSMTSYIKER